MPEEAQRRYNESKLNTAIYSGLLVSALEEIALQNRQRYPHGSNPAAFYESLRQTLHNINQDFPVAHLTLSQLLPSEIAEQVENPLAIFRLFGEFNVLVTRCKGFSQIHSAPKYRLYREIWFDEKEFAPLTQEFRTYRHFTDTFCPDCTAHVLGTIE